MRRKVGKIGITITLLLIMIISNFLFVYESIASSILYVTNHENIEFSTYFKDEQGNKQETSELTYQNKEKTLYFNINVKKEGYFNGMIALENANFNCVQEQEKNDKISKIEGNKIYLNQINASSNVEIPVKIEMITDDIYDLNLCNRQTDVILEGTYKDNTQKDITINSQKQVTAKLVKGNESLQTNTEVITNKILPVDGEEKRVIQIALDISYYDYPIKEFNITMPQIGDDTKVIANLNTMTKIEEVRYTNSTAKTQENKISICLKNEPNEENKVIWKKSGSERIVVTYLYNKDTSTEDLSIKTQIEATLYDGTIVNAQDNTIEVSEERDAIVTTSLNCEEKEIYKGKLYANLDREIKTNIQVNINLAKVTKNINITEPQATWITQEDQEATVNAVYQATKLKKEELEKVLGEKGTLTIDSIEEGQNRTIVQIDKNSEANENGEIIIEYPENVTKIQYYFTNVEQEGVLNLQTTKVIKENEREIVQVAKKLQNKVSAYYQIKDEIESKKELNSSIYEIDLKEPTTQAILEINKESLSTVNENKNVEIRAILKSNSEEDNLYKNPKIVIELPQEIENIEINSIQKFAGDEFEMQTKQIEVNGNKAIEIELKGEQKDYKKISEQGITILIDANLKIYKKTVSTTSSIKMSYTNENANTNEILKSAQPFIITKEIKMIAPKELIAINNVKELEIETIGESKEQVVSLKEQENKVFTIESEIINNNDSEIENIVIQGMLPINGEIKQNDTTYTNNGNIKIKDEISLSNENAKLYYTNNPEATQDVQYPQNGWTEELVSNAVKYLIILPKMEKAESLKVTYTIQTPEEFESNQQSYLGYVVNYQNVTTKIQSEVSSTRIKLETDLGGKIEVALVGTIGGETITDNSTVKRGEVIRYQLQIKNTGSEKLEGIIATAKIPEGTVYVEPYVDLEAEPPISFEYTGGSYYKEVEKENQEFIIDFLEAGKSITKEYEVKVKKEAEIGSILQNQFNINYAEENKTTNKISNIVEDGELIVTTKRITDSSIKLFKNGNINYYTAVKNTGENTLSNVTVVPNISNNLTVNQISILSGEITEEEIGNKIESEEIEYKSKIEIGSLKPGEIKIVLYKCNIESMKQSVETLSITAKAEADGKTYRSNLIQDIAYQYDVEANMTVDKEGELQAGDEITYTINITNHSQTKLINMKIEDTIPSPMTIKSIKIDGEETEIPNINKIILIEDLEREQTLTVHITAIVNYSELREEPEVVTNRATMEIAGEEIAQTQDIAHIIARNKSDTSPEIGGYLLTGIAWIDNNQNGAKDADEEVLEGTEVQLLDLQTNQIAKDVQGQDLVTKTKENGFYVLNHIPVGNYIVVFPYDRAKYRLTTYQAEGVAESQNSKVIEKELSLNGETRKYAVTDTITIENQNIANINIGFIENEMFNMRLDKYVSRIIVQTEKGTYEYNYNDEKIAKVEIDAKQLNQANVMVEYKIKVTNCGEVEGYINKIADYVSNQYQFNPNQNLEWYSDGETLYTNSLANTPISPGESKEIKLVLSKLITQDNVGLINNTSEIVESYNTQGIPDVNSTPNNKVAQEDDYSSADVIISIRTGKMLTYMIGSATIIIILSGCGYWIKRKRKEMK